MPRYVDADKELAEMKFAWYPQDMDTTNAIGMYENFLKNAPSADVAPVVHAHWSINKEYMVFVCSNCGKSPTEGTGHTFDAKMLKARNYNYCRYCGAKMDEVVKT